MRPRYIDITVPVYPGMRTWPGDPEDRYREGTIVGVELGAHTGTHVDAPRHYLVEGPTVEQLALDDLCGP